MIIEFILDLIIYLFIYRRYNFTTLKSIQVIILDLMFQGEINHFQGPKRMNKGNFLLILIIHFIRYKNLRNISYLLGVSKIKNKKYFTLKFCFTEI